MAEIEKDDVTGTETTGHTWDGIKELNTPLPRWWLWTWYISIVWGIGYLIAYPAIPLFDSVTPGLLGYSSRAEVMAEIDEARAGNAKYLDRIAELPLEEIAKDADLMSFAMAGGRSAYAVNCVQCHGTGAAGAPGYPNLNDDDWLWGGSLEEVSTTIAHGIRFDSDDDTRTSEMPRFGADQLLEPAQIADVANYVSSLSKQEHDAAAAERGAEIYSENCLSCHGENGKGDREQGAAKLNDAIWLYGGRTDQIIASVSNPQNGVMPAWGHRLDEVTIKLLTLYIHSLGGGE
jgi:cytochrome c oxidase cbb3-type subunit 3